MSITQGQKKELVWYLAKQATRSGHNAARCVVLEKKSLDEIVQGCDKDGNENARQNHVVLFTAESFVFHFIGTLCTCMDGLST